jgi:hypothetical protein
MQSRACVMLPCRTCEPHFPSSSVDQVMQLACPCASLMPMYAGATVILLLLAALCSVLQQYTRHTGGKV